MLYYYNTVTLRNYGFLTILIVELNRYYTKAQAFN